MNSITVLSDILQQFAYVIRRVIGDLPSNAMQWQPDEEANNIALTVWHICRALDVLKVKILDNQPDHEQLWFTCGWADRTGYNPAGLGIGGFGNLAGYTQEQVKDVPLLSAAESLAYFDQVYTALNDHLVNLSSEALEQAPPGWPVTLGVAPDTVYDVLLMFLLDNREHLGEIKAIKAMWQRKQAPLPANS